MKKIGLVGLVAGALSAAVIGFAGPAQADGNGYGFSGPANEYSYGYYYGHGYNHGYNYGHDYGYGYGRDRDHRNNPWLDQIYPSVKVPHVDTSVRN